MAFEPTQLAFSVIHNLAYNGNFSEAAVLLEVSNLEGPDVDTLKEKLNYNAKFFNDFSIDFIKEKPASALPGTWTLNPVGDSEEFDLKGISHLENEVYLFIDGFFCKVIKGQPVEGDCYTFFYRLREPLRKLLSVKSSITVVTARGVLVGPEGKLAYAPSFKGSKGTLASRLKSGEIFTKSGWMKKPLLVNTDLKNRFCEIYPKVREILQSDFGVDLFIVYGSLLGIARNNDFIPHDDDIDVAYLSKCDNAADAKLEKIEIIRKLQAAGFSISISGDSLYFLVSTADNLPVFDVFTGWCSDGEIKMLNTTIMSGGISMFYPTQEVEYRGIKLAIPSDTEGFLEKKYGISWRKPDSSYSTRADWPKIIKTFRELKLNEAEKAALLASNSKKV